jgi:hypothetical protein
MNAKQITNYIPTELLQELCLKYKTDQSGQEIRWSIYVSVAIV